MNSMLIGLIVFGCVFGAGLLSLLLRAWLPQHHLSAETKDTVRLAMGLVATMAALVLGLLVASAKASYDTEKSEVIVMASKVAFLDHLLEMYGPDAAETRGLFHKAVQSMIDRLWPQSSAQPAQLAPPTTSAQTAFRALQKLSPQTDEQRLIKAQAIAIATDFGQMRWLLSAQSGSSISFPLLVVVVGWLAILFFSFGLFSPLNGTVVAALLVAALSVAGAIFLIMELDQPFGGMIQISSQPMTSALVHSADQ